MTKKQVLVIDDNPDIQRLVQIILEELAGWNVLIATSGIEGIDLAMQENPDAILLDVMMPILDGIETFKKLQENGKTQKIPTIFLTARVMVNEQEYLSSLGAKGIIIKPFNPDILAQDICDLLDWRTMN
jgi:CheY-like chemotaxis protein